MSETLRKSPDPAVISWLTRHDADLALPTVTIAEIAAAHGISESHLTKVVHQLGRSATIETVRGKGGGMRLAKSPSAIVLGDVIRQAEGEVVLAECFAANSTCRIQAACRLQGILAEALRAMFSVLDAYTLADLLETPDGQLQAIVWNEGALRVAETPRLIV